MHTLKKSLAALMLLSNSPSALAEPSSDVALTVYSSADPGSFDPQQFISQQSQGHNPSWVWGVPGFGVVKEQRTVQLQSGLNELKFTDVAQYIDPTTVSFSDETDAATSVSEQNFQFDLANADKILQRYIDRQVTVSVSKGQTSEDVTGVLVSANNGQIVLKTPQGVQLLNRNDSQVKLGELPGGLITKPTLVWKIKSPSLGSHKVRTTYQTAGLTWRSDYNLILNSKDTGADLGAWVTLLNVSGSGYANASLKLIAGDVQRVQGYPAPTGGMMEARSVLAKSDDSGFVQKPFFEYHLYSLPTRVDVAANSTQQIALFPTVKNFKVEKLLVYYGLPEAAYWGYYGTPQTDRNYGSGSNKKLDVYIQFKNEEKNKLGFPLPKGKVRVYKQDDADQNLEFIGEDLIDHTARDEKVLVKLGQSFDVVGERTQNDYSIDLNAHRIQESFKILLKNHKDEPQRVIVKENLYRWVNWEITAKSDPFEKIDSRTVHFTVDVPARGEKTVTYTARYSW